MDLSERNQVRRSSWPLWSILAICVLPIIAGTALYFLWTPTQFVNHGELLKPVSLAEAVLLRNSGGKFAFSELSPNWSFVSIDDGACDENCRKKLYLMRQLRLTQGKDAERIERVWLIRDGEQPAAKVLAGYDGTQAVVLAPKQSLVQFAVDGNVTDYIYLIDPFGNLMMRFSLDTDPSMIKKDLAKLLRISSGWRSIER
jgi:hypothetical protein